MALFENPNTKVEKIIDGLSTGLGSIAFGVTALALVVACPLAGAALGASYMGAAAAGSAFIVKIAASVAGIIGGGALGLAPLAVTTAIGHKKDPSYGVIETMCIPAQGVDYIARLALSPLKIFDLGNSFNKAAAKNKAAPSAAPQQSPKDTNTPKA